MSKPDKSISFNHRMYDLVGKCMGNRMMNGAWLSRSFTIKKSNSFLLLLTLMTFHKQKTASLNIDFTSSATQKASEKPTVLTKRIVFGTYNSTRAPTILEAKSFKESIMMTWIVPLVITTIVLSTLTVATRQVIALLRVSKRREISVFFLSFTPQATTVFNTGKIVENLWLSYCDLDTEENLQLLVKSHNMKCVEFDQPDCLLITLSQKHHISKVIVKPDVVVRNLSISYLGGDKNCTKINLKCELKAKEIVIQWKQKHMYLCNIFVYGVPITLRKMKNKETSQSQVDVMILIGPVLLCILIFFLLTLLLRAVVVNVWIPLKNSEFVTNVNEYVKNIRIEMKKQEVANRKKFLLTRPRKTTLMESLESEYTYDSSSYV